MAVRAAGCVIGGQVFSLDVDIGGTFTDGFFSNGPDVKTAKVLTTPHDVTEGFLDCIRLGSSLFDLALDEFLRRTQVARLSTTIGTNLLVQKKGERIGLLVTAGHEETLYSSGKPLARGRLVAADMVIGIAEEVDEHGAIRQAVDPDAVLDGVRALIQRNAQIILVSFRNAWLNPGNERAVRRIVRERYPVHYLRSVPVQLGIEVVHDRDDHARTNSALLNAYIHAEMARILFRAEDKLRACGYDRPLLIVHASGGNARVAKTVALNTLHSGPAVAVRGAAVLAQLLDLPRVVSTDMGGTSFDVGFVTDGKAAIEATPHVDAMPIATPTIQVHSIGLGGGSIASVADGVLKVGPESAGSAPGPAAYGKGGGEPTVTDANVILGFIDPDFFLGGRMKLDLAAARRAVERRVARHKQCSVEEAAFDIRTLANRQMADEIARDLAAVSFDPAQTSLFSAGGAGPLHACEVADAAGLKQAIAFPFGSVFSAFGGSTTDVQHVYRHAFGAARQHDEDLAPVLADLIRQARLDMRGEGFPPHAVALTAEADTGGGSAVETAVNGDAGATAAAALRQKVSGRPIHAVSVRAVSAIPHWTPARRTAERRTLSPRAERPVWWQRSGASPTPVFDREALQPGDVIAGPAIVEGADTVYAVRPGWRMSVDPYGFFIISRG
jgi:N-methylhydantoinase A